MEEVKQKTLTLHFSIRDIRSRAAGIGRCEQRSWDITFDPANELEDVDGKWLSWTVLRSSRNQTMRKAIQPDDRLGFRSRTAIGDRGGFFGRSTRVLSVCRRYRGTAMKFISTDSPSQDSP